MKTWRIIGVVVLLVLTSCFLWLKWKHDEPRRLSIASLQTLREALKSNDSGSLLNAIVLPQALEGRTVHEQTEFLTKALRDEISPEGLMVLKKQGTFGPLKELFPNEADAWAKQAGVKPEDCIAFKLERNGQRAEVVLFQNPERGTRNAELRIVHCNNVKQLAATL